MMAEKAYYATIRECFAVKWAVLQARNYLEGSSFTVCTNYDALRGIMNMADAYQRKTRLLEIKISRI